MTVTFYAYKNKRPLKASPEVNLANVNARLVLDALGFDSEDLCGRCYIPDARMALIRVWSKWHGHGPEGLERRLQYFRELVHDAQDLGADEIVWG